MDVSLKADDARSRIFARLEGLAGVVEERRELSRPLLTGVKIIMRRAKQLAPRDSGFLRSQIIAWTNVRKTDAPLTGFVTVATRAKRNRAGELSRAKLAAKASKGRKTDLVTAYYGRFIEQGTSKLDPHPYLSRAVDEVGDEAIEAALAGARGVLLKMVEVRL